MPRAKDTQEGVAALAFDSSNQVRRRPAVVRTIAAGGRDVGRGTVSVQEPSTDGEPRDLATATALPNAAPMSWSDGLALATVEGKEPAKAQGRTLSGLRTARPKASGLHSQLQGCIRGWLQSGRAASAVVAACLSGRRNGWRDGVLQDLLERHGSRLTLDQWVVLLSLARAVDVARMTGSTSSLGEDVVHRPLTVGDCSTLLLLRGMLAVQPASLCLGALRQQPSLADRLPPEGYVELLYAIKREAERDTAPALPYTFADDNQC